VNHAFKEKSGRKHVIRNHRRASNTEFPNYLSGIYLLLFSMMMNGNGFRKPTDREAISSANGATRKGTPKCLTLLLQAKKE
jgi:hypothetical protein